MVVASGPPSAGNRFDRRPEPEYEDWYVRNQRGAAMAKVSPFHTDSEEYPMAHREVYHDNDACYEGKKIFHEHRQGGTGGKPLCEVCAGLS